MVHTYAPSVLKNYEVIFCNEIPGAKTYWKAKTGSWKI